MTVVLPAAPPLPVVSHDPNDDPIIATALAGPADVLCTLDRHMHHASVRSFCAAQGIRVLTDIELLSVLRAIEPPTKPSAERQN